MAKGFEAEVFWPRVDLVPITAFIRDGEVRARSDGRLRLGGRGAPDVQDVVPRVRRGRSDFRWFRRDQ